MADPRLLPAAHSPAFLDKANPLARTPRAQHRPRPEAFYEGYEAKALFYDAFWHADGARVLLVGPPPLNLWPAYKAARFSTGRPRFFPSASTMITELSGVPAGTGEIIVTLGGQSHVLPIQPSSAAALAGRRVLFTLSKDNDLAWIAEWARYHVKFHGVDAVVFFDNGSTRYGTDEIAQTLLATPGIAHAAVQAWPYRYGAPDPEVRINPFYVQFLQVSAMSVALRRYGAQAAGLLNLDIDELAITPSGTIFDHLERTPRGLLILSGQYIEPVPVAGAPAERTHRHFALRYKDPEKALSRPKKWALDPRRPWVKHLGVHPYMHWIRRRPLFSKATDPDIYYLHFRGISTNWKDQRAVWEGMDLTALETDPVWPGLAARF